MLFPSLFHAQERIDFNTLEKQISTLANQMHTDSSLQQRIAYSNEILKLLNEKLILKGSFEYSFSKLEGISMLKPSDNKFKIFTWEMFVDKNKYQQFGIIQTADEKVYVLEDKSDDMKQAEYLRLKPENWYGALYYHVQPFVSGLNNETQYLLLGRDSYGFYERRKLIEVLYFDFMGRPRFGNSSIQIKDGRGQLKMVNRYFLQYSTMAAVTLRYDESLKMVVFDHLVSGAPVAKSAPASNIPDGSFNGLKANKGKWEFVDMVFEYDNNNVLENAFNPHEIMRRNDKKRDEEKDIFGKDKNKKSRKP